VVVLVLVLLVGALDVADDEVSEVVPVSVGLVVSDSVVSEVVELLLPGSVVGVVGVESLGVASVVVAAVLGATLPSAGARSPSTAAAVTAGPPSPPPPSSSAGTA
jgi:hypothetical protein